MKIPHKTHGWAPDRTDPAWAERVEREAERIADQAEARWRKAQRRLANAEAKARLAESTARVSPKRIERLWAVVEERRQELKQCERLMNKSPAGSEHRGVGSHRGVSRGEVF